MPTLDWLNREQAKRVADAVPYRMLESVASPGDPAAGNLLIQSDKLDHSQRLSQMNCTGVDDEQHVQGRGGLETTARICSFLSPNRFRVSAL
jgi:hypothetical protein